jgi:hypothetical protein
MTVEEVVVAALGTMEYLLGRSVKGGLKYQMELLSYSAPAIVDNSSSQIPGPRLRFWGESSPTWKTALSMSHPSPEVDLIRRCPMPFLKEAAGSSTEKQAAVSLGGRGSVS